MSQISLYGFLRMGLAVPELRVADVVFNTDGIRALIQEAAALNCQLLVFPELCITGYSCGDLFYQRALLHAAEKALISISEACGNHRVASVVGLPILFCGRLFNTAVLIGADGQVIGAVPKTFLPNNGEFYESRWFTSGYKIKDQEILINGILVAFGSDLLFEVAHWSECILGIELCEDLWAVKPPSLDQALSGATVIVNLSASNELLGKCSYRRNLVKQQSARCLSVYAYVSSGPGESTMDVVYSGHGLIAENGEVLAETERFRFDSQLILSEVDIQKLTHDRSRNSSFSQSAPSRIFRRLSLNLSARCNTGKLLRQIPPHPFVPSDSRRRAEHCREIFSIQSTGLAKRLRHTGCRKICVGLSGGLDSTLAILVAIRSFDQLGLDRKGIMAVTMPGFGTTNRTRSNAEKLAEMLGTSLCRIPIVDAVRQHFCDLGHSEEQHDVTYENAQARERTQILMDISNKIGGFVLGTGDLSELALGWCTFNGDHMSMYHVNAGVPKTLVRYLVQWCAEEVFTGGESAVLRDIIETPISPELLPVGEDGSSEQKTEDTIGPYELHDFFLYYFVRHAFSPEKISFLAHQAFVDFYDPAVIDHWLNFFYLRFFSQQFKRSSMPDGPKIGSVALSPRGDWRMPSDAVPAVWTQPALLLR